MKRIHCLKEFGRDIFTYSYNFVRYGLIGDMVAIDASTVCQLQCPVCPQVERPGLGILGNGFLSFIDFKAFVDQHPTIRHIELSNYGEIFLNPQLQEIIEYAYKKGVCLHAANGVNFNWVSDEMIDTLVRCQFRTLTISIDGVSEKTYGTYRRGGSLDRVLDNIRRLNAAKTAQGSAYPQLTWQFIVFQHNQDEINDARRLADELSMRFLLKKNWSETYASTPESEKIFPDGNIYSNGNNDSGSVNEQKYQCRNDILYLPHINWDGKLLGCCVNMERSFGNVFSSGLRTCMKGKAYTMLKHFLLHPTQAHVPSPCAGCASSPQASAVKEGAIPCVIMKINMFLRFLWLRVIRGAQSSKVSVEARNA